MPLTIMNLVKPKVGDKHEQTGLKTLIFLTKSLCLTKDLGVTDFVAINAINLVTLCCTTQVIGMAKIALS